MSPVAHFVSCLSLNAISPPPSLHPHRAVVPHSQYKPPDPAFPFFRSAALFSPLLSRGAAVQEFKAETPSSMRSLLRFARQSGCYLTSGRPALTSEAERGLKPLPRRGSRGQRGVRASAPGRSEARWGSGEDTQLGWLAS